MVAISPGRYHHKVPKGRVANLHFRRWILARCRKNRKYRRAVVAACRRDIIFFIDAFVWQTNPNSFGTASAEVGPFVAWEYQEDAVKDILSAIQGRYDLVIEKSREMGASWLCLIVMLWYTLFHPMKKFLCVSKDADSVDCEDPDSLFWKLRYMVDHLPRWLTPNLKIQKFLIKNEDNGSVITGVASTADAGVGGRATAIFVDEFTLIKKDFAVLNHTANTSRCRIFNGTHRGTGTALFELTNPEDAASSFVKKLQMHWTRHPDKNRGCYHYDAATQQIVPHDKSYEYPPDYHFVTDGKPSGGPHPGVRSPWYDDMVANRIKTAQAVAMDLDIDPQGSVENPFNPVMIRSLVSKYALPPLWEGDVFEGDGGRPRFVRRAGGKTALWVTLDADDRPTPGTFVFGVDPSHGVGATPSCVQGVNAVTGTKVLSFADPRIEPTPLARLCLCLCNWFADDSGAGAWLIWEIQGPGAVFGKRVIEDGYRRVYYRVDETKVRTRVSDAPGWNSDARAKDSLILEYRDALMGGPEGRYLNRCETSLRECLNFKFKDDGHLAHGKENSPNDKSGAKINHGDRVIADALAWKMVLQLGKLAKLGAEELPEKIQPNSLAFRRLLAADAAGKARRPWAT
jgi:hypothetical protein